MRLKITKLCMGTWEVVALYGSANATKQSRSNDESMLRFTGSALIASILKKLRKTFARAAADKQ